MKHSIKSTLFIFLSIEILVIILLFKSVRINYLFMGNEEILSNNFFQIITHDSIILFFILLSSYLSYLKITPYLISILFRIITLCIFTLYVIDIFILENFATHIIIYDVFKYINYLPSYLNQHYILNIFTILSALILFFIIYLFIFKKFIITSFFHHSIFLFFLSISLITYTFANNGRYVHSWIFKNFIEYNYQILSQSRNYSEEFKKNIVIDDKIECKTSIQNNKNIIILMVESLSSYQSNFFSGLNNWTPFLDTLAKENISFTNFHANGFMTEDAEISLITGHLPIYAPEIFSDGGGVSFNGFYNIKESLPNILNSKGYNTEFITSADLDFSNTRTWTKSIGFKYIEGSLHSFYKNKKRFHFDAVEDKYLYHRVLNRIDKQSSKYFMFIKTVSSHIPFINPENGKNSEKETIKYVDKQIQFFYEKLKNKNFFKNGLLIIVGDHYPLKPLKKEEIKLFGTYKAHTYVPMVLIENKKKLNINSQFQQTDVFNSIKNYVSGQSCSSDWVGDFLVSKPLSPKYIYHRRGDNRGIISIFENNKVYNIKLNGDKTAIINQDKEIPNIINKINYERIQRQKNSQ